MPATAVIDDSSINEDSMRTMLPQKRKSFKNIDPSINMGVSTNKVVPIMKAK